MGIYVFNRDVLIDCLDNDLVDFGKHIIPQVDRGTAGERLHFQGYWEDIGTIRAFYEANLDLTDLLPQYSFFEAAGADLYAPAFFARQQDQRRDLAPGDHLRRLHHFRRAHRALRHRRAQHHPKRRHDSEQHRHGRRLLRTDPASDRRGLPPIGIGRNCVIDRAIIDKNARIADGVVITPEGKPENFDAENYFIRDGIVVVPKNAVSRRDFGFDGVSKGRDGAPINTGSMSIAVSVALTARESR